MAKCTILLALAAITINVGLSNSVDHFGSHLLSSPSWKTNFQDKFNVDQRKPFGLLFPRTFLVSKPFEKVVSLNSLDNVKKNFHLGKDISYLRKPMPFYIHARSNIPKRSSLFNDSAELKKNMFRDQSAISHFTLRKPVEGIKPLHKSSSERLILKSAEFVDFDKYVSFGKPYKSSDTSTTSHSENQPDLYYEYNKSQISYDKTIPTTKPYKNSDDLISIVEATESIDLVNNSDLVDFNQYVSYGKPYKSSDTSTTSHSENQSDLYYEYNKSSSFDKTIPTTKPYKNSDGLISIVEATESIDLVNNSDLADLNQYVSFGKPYKTEENVTHNTLGNQNISHKETSEEVKKVIYPVFSDFNKFISFGIPYKSGENLTSVPSISDESSTEPIDLVNNSDLVDFDKYVSFGLPYKTAEGKIANELKQGFKQQLIVFDSTGEKALEHNASETFMVTIKENSVPKMPLNNFQNISSIEKSNDTNHFDITGYATDLFANEFNSQSDASRKTKIIEPFGTEGNVALLNNISSSDLSNSSNVLSVNAHEALGLPISFLLPIEEHNYLENNETPVSKTKCERLEGKPLIVCTNENSKNVSTITFDVPSKYSSMFAAMITDALSENNTNLYDKETLHVISEALNATRIEENISSENRFVEANDNLKGSQISRRRDELLKSEEFIEAVNYQLESIDEGSGEVP